MGKGSGEMTTKDGILKTLDNELTTFISHIENNERELNNKINDLKKRIKFLEADNVKLRTQLDNVEKTDGFNYYFNRLSEGITYQLLDRLCLSSSIHDAKLLLHIANKLWVDNDYEMLSYLLELLGHNQTALVHNDQELKEQFLRLSEDILLGDQTSSEPESDKLFIFLLELISQLFGTPMQRLILPFLLTNESTIFDNVLYTNDPAIIIKYLRVLNAFERFNELKAALIHLLDVEWSFIESSLTNEDMIFLLWYYYLFDFDEDLIEIGSMNIQQLDATIDDVALYFYINNEKRYMKDIVDRKFLQFNKGTILKSNEKKQVLQKVRSSIDSSIVIQKKAHVSYDPVFLLQDNWREHFFGKKELRKEFISMPLYQDKNSNLVNDFAEMDVLIDKWNKEIYITEDQLKHIVNAYGLYPKMKKDHLINFVWPSTEVKESKQETDKEEKTLNEKSALMLMGYKVSGNLTRVKRWEILQKAVPKLGLKRVAYTISYNVKLRKGQKNGEERFVNAITEWEHDLNKLKTTYYKKDFKWPIT